MSFIQGFKKTAQKGNLTQAIAKGIAEAVESGKAVGRGIKSTGAHTIGDTLKLKGLKHVPEAAKARGGFGKALGSKEGRLALWEAAGKAAPSVGAAGLYGGLGYKALKKVYDSTAQDPYSQYYY